MRLACLALLTLVLAPIAPGDAPAPRVYIRTGPPPWKPLSAQGTDRALTFRVEPAQTVAGRAWLLINPAPGMDINDTTPPRIAGISVDGKPKTPRADLSLGRGNWQPHRVCFSVRDGANSVGAAKCAVDGKAVASASVSVANPLTPSIVYELPGLDYGAHQITFSVCDTSPQANEATLSIRWERYDPTDYAHAASGARLTADSVFDGYPSLAALQDGKTDLPGDHCLNDVSWASAETADPHWVEVDLGRPRRVHEVSLFWALYAGKYHTATRFDVQVPAGRDWRTIWAPQQPLEPAKVTTAAFAPVVTQRLRVLQPAGAGSGGRPDLMWLGEVMVR